MIGIDFGAGALSAAWLNQGEPELVIGATASKAPMPARVLRRANGELAIGWSADVAPKKGETLFTRPLSNLRTGAAHAGLLLERIRLEVERMRERAERPERALTIATPSWLRALDRCALLEVASAIGLSSVRLIHRTEAIAAWFTRERGTSETILILDYDEDGFDLCVAEIGDGVIEDRFLDGRADLGFRAVEQLMVSKLLAGRNTPDPSYFQFQLRRALQELTLADHAEIAGADPSGRRLFVRRTDFLAACKPHLDQIATEIHQAARQWSIDRVLVSSNAPRGVTWSRILKNARCDRPVITAPPYAAALGCLTRDVVVLERALRSIEVPARSGAISLLPAGELLPAVREVEVQVAAGGAIPILERDRRDQSAVLGELSMPALPENAVVVIKVRASRDELTASAHDALDRQISSFDVTKKSALSQNEAAALREGLDALRSEQRRARLDDRANNLIAELDAFGAILTPVLAASRELLLDDRLELERRERLLVDVAAELAAHARAALRRHTRAPEETRPSDPIGLARWLRRFEFDHRQELALLAAAIRHARDPVAQCEQLLQETNPFAFTLLDCPSGHWERVARSAPAETLDDLAVCELLRATDRARKAAAFDHLHQALDDDALERIISAIAGDAELAAELGEAILGLSAKAVLNLYFGLPGKLSWSSPRVEAKLKASAQKMLETSGHRAHKLRLIEWFAPNDARSASVALLFAATDADEVVRAAAVKHLRERTLAPDEESLWELMKQPRQLHKKTKQLDRLAGIATLAPIVVRLRERRWDDSGQLGLCPVDDSAGRLAIAPGAGELSVADTPEQS